MSKKSKTNATATATSYSEIPPAMLPGENPPGASPAEAGKVGPKAVSRIPSEAERELMSLSPEMMERAKSLSKKMLGPFKVGECYLIRATYYSTGRVYDILDDFICLEDAAWVANTGLLHKFLAGQSPAEEIAPVDKVFVNSKDICDAFPWPHPLPRTAS